MSHFWVKFCLFGSLILFVCALWRGNQIPERETWQPALLTEPQQTPTERLPFSTSAGGVTYQITPLYEYELYGMVVSRHRADTWWDYLHAEWNDHLNITDLCVIWGDNGRNDAYKEFSFYSQQFTCNYSTNSQEAYTQFNQSALSNNHLLSDKESLVRLLRQVQVGDQVHLRGVLAEYAHQHEGQNFKRGSSVTRNDTGNGACETIYLDSLEIIQKGGGGWRALKWLAVVLFIISLVAWFRLPMNPPD